MFFGEFRVDHNICEGSHGEGRKNILSYSTSKMRLNTMARLHNS